MDEKKPSIPRIVFSVLAAFFGVQSDKNRERDFTQGKPIHFIIAGVIMTVLFILLIWLIVTLVLSGVGVKSH